MTDKDITERPLGAQPSARRRRGQPKRGRARKGAVFINKRVDGDYVHVPNAIAQNADLSLAERGLLLFALSLPADWEFRPQKAAKVLGRGKNSVYRLVDGLKDKGYARVHQPRLSTGRMGEVEYHFTATPWQFAEPTEPEEVTASPKEGTGEKPSKSPLPQKPVPGGPVPGFQGATKTTSHKVNSHKGKKADFARLRAGSGSGFVEPTCSTSPASGTAPHDATAAPTVGKTGSPRRSPPVPYSLTTAEEDDIRVHGEDPKALYQRYVDGHRHSGLTINTTLFRYLLGIAKRNDRKRWQAQAKAVAKVAPDALAAFRASRGPAWKPKQRS